LRRSPRRISHRALAVHFQALSPHLRLLRDHHPVRAAVALQAAVVVAVAAEAGNLQLM
jgi:hypothetical protein